MNRPELLPIPENLSIIVVPEEAEPVIKGLYLARVAVRLSRTQALSHLRWDRVHVRLKTEETEGRKLGWAVDNADGDKDGVKLPGEKLVVIANRPRATKASVFGTTIHEFGHLISNGHGKKHVDACLTIAWQAGILTSEEYEHGLDTITDSQVGDGYIQRIARDTGLLDLLSTPPGEKPDAPYVVDNRP